MSFKGSGGHSKRKGRRFGREGPFGGLERILKGWEGLARRKGWEGLAGGKGWEGLAVGKVSIAARKVLLESSFEGENRGSDFAAKLNPH